MPELDELIEAVRAETERVRWADAAEVRAGADRRRRRRQVVAVLAVAAVLLVITGLGGLLGRTERAVPTAPPASPTSPVISPGALLTPADLGPGYIAGEQFDAPYAPSPFAYCGRDGFPHDTDLVSARGTSMRKPGAYSTVGVSVLAFRPGTAQLAMAGIGELLAGPCKGHFTLVGRDLGGTESMLIRGQDAEPGNAGARRIAYQAIVRSGDFIAWVTAADYASRPDFAAWARSLGTRAAQRL